MSTVLIYSAGLSHSTALSQLIAPHGAPSIVFGALSIRMCIRFVELRNASDAILSTLF